MTALAHEMSAEETEGSYVYGVVRRREAPSEFSQTPLPGAGDIRIVTAGDLGVIVSPMPIEEVDPSRRNLLAHTRVLEEAMETGSVLPVRFGTIAETPSLLREILDHHAEDLHDLFDHIDGRIELGVKALWNMEQVFAEITVENPKLQQLKEQLTGSNEARTYYQRIDLGRRIEDAMNAKRETEAAQLMGLMTPFAVDARIAKATEDRMVVNAAFLVDAQREQAFDAVIQDIRAREGERMSLRYVGPVPPYSFVDLKIDWSPTA